MNSDFKLNKLFLTQLSKSLLHICYSKSHENGKL